MSKIQIIYDINNTDIQAYTDKNKKQVGWHVTLGGVDTFLDTLDH